MVQAKTVPFDPAAIETAEQARAMLEELTRTSDGSGLKPEVYEVKNRLAYLTAEAFVVVDDGTTVELYGISSEEFSSVRGPHLFTLIEAPHLSATGAYRGTKYMLNAAHFHVRLVPGDWIEFEIVGDADRKNASFTVGTFSGDNQTAAVEWLMKRRHLHPAST